MEFIKSYKGRKIDYSKPVDVYRCLPRKGRVYSIRQNGKVVGHTEVLNLSNVNFIVNESGKRRAICTKTRNVHAFIRGYINDSISGIPMLYPLSYCPFNKEGFMLEGKEVQSSPFVVIRNFGVYAAR